MLTLMKSQVRLVANEDHCDGASDFSPPLPTSQTGMTIPSNPAEAAHVCKIACCWFCSVGDLCSNDLSSGTKMMSVPLWCMCATLYFCMNFLLLRFYELNKLDEMRNYFSSPNDRIQWPQKPTEL